MYKDLKKKPQNSQLCICRCPGWCEEGYIIARWNGKIFEASTDLNGDFNKYAIAYLPLNEDGEPKTMRKLFK